MMNQGSLVECARIDPLDSTTNRDLFLDQLHVLVLVTQGRTSEKYQFLPLWQLVYRAIRSFLSYHEAT